MSEVPYDVDFEWDESHGRLIRLLIDRPARGLVIDLGCGYAPHAEPLRDNGFTYVGLDLDPASVAAVARRGFDAYALDLGARDEVLALVRRVADQSSDAVVAVLALDVIEHLVDPHLLLADVSRWMSGHDGAVLGVSVPNVAHHDVAAKLVGGRWDVTSTGLLDHTHVRFFTGRSLEALAASSGFREVVRGDRPAPVSDQRWPVGSPFVAAGARLAELLRHVRSRADEHAETYQFIRLYEPSDEAVAPTILAGRDDADVLLSVVAHPDLTAAELDDLEVRLAEQSSADWELVASLGAESLDDVVDRAVGLFVSIVEPGERIGREWVAAFAVAARDADGDTIGTILRAPDGVGVPPAIAAIPELGSLEQPSASVAIPTAALRGLGLVVGDGDLRPVVEMLVGAVQFCGVRQTDGCRVEHDRSHAPDHAALAARVAALDHHPVVMPAGVLGRLTALEADIARLRRDNDWLNAELRSTPVRVLRRALRRPPTAR